MMEYKVVSNTRVEITEKRRWRSTDFFRHYKTETFTKQPSGGWYGEFRGHDHFLDSSIETFVTLRLMGVQSYQRRWLISSEGSYE